MRNWSPCVYEPHRKGKVRCAYCGAVRKILAENPDYTTYVRKCTVNRLGPCQHLGEKVGTVECKMCQGFVLLNVFTCAVHGQCVLKKHVGLPVCDRCPDFSRREESD